MSTYSPTQFLARDSCLRIAIARPSVRQSVRHTGGSVKKVEVRIMKFSPYGRSIPLFHLEILTGSPSGGVKQLGCGEKAAFSLALNVSRKWQEIRPKLLLTTNRKLHMRFRD